MSNFYQYRYPRVEVLLTMLPTALVADAYAVKIPKRAKDVRAKQWGDALASLGLFMLADSSDSCQIVAYEGAVGGGLRISEITFMTTSAGRFGGCSYFRDDASQAAVILAAEEFVLRASTPCIREGTGVSDPFGDARSALLHRLGLERQAAAEVAEREAYRVALFSGEVAE